MSGPLRFAAVDVETTGEIVGYHEIIEVAVVLADERLEVEREWVRKLMPAYPKRLDPEAAAVNGYTPEGWLDAGALPPAERYAVLRELGELLAGRALIGHSVLTFDEPHLHAALRARRLKPAWRHRAIDTFPFAVALCVPWGSRPAPLRRASLVALAELLGVDHPHAHTALCDARTALECARRLRAALHVEPAAARRAPDGPGAAGVRAAGGSP